MTTKNRTGRVPDWTGLVRPATLPKRELGDGYPLTAVTPAARAALERVTESLVDFLDELDAPLEDIEKFADDDADDSDFEHSLTAPTSEPRHATSISKETTDA